MKEEIFKGVRVGWLDGPFPQGKISQELLNRLAYIGKNYRVQCCKGHHICEICFPDSREYYEPENKQVQKQLDFYHWGNGELWIKGKDNIVWQAPTMIVHYIHMHHYLPPKQFLEDLENLKEEESGHFYHQERQDHEDRRKEFSNAK